MPCGTFERYDAWARERGAEQRGVVIRLRMARFEALCGKTAEALARVDRELAGGVSPHLKIEALKVVVSAGDLARTARLIDELDRAAWPGVAQPDAGFMAAYRAALETGRRRPDRALEILRSSQPFELGFSWGFIPLYERARAHLAADDWRAAQAAFEKMLTHPTVSSGQKLLPMAQLGVARVLCGLRGQAAESRKAFESFFTLWRGADADLPLLAQARQDMPGCARAAKGYDRSVGRAPQDPFDGTQLEGLQPARADDHLDGHDRQREHHGRPRAYRPEPAEPGVVEDQSQRQRLGEVVGQRRPSDGGEPHHQWRALAPLAPPYAPAAYATASASAPASAHSQNTNSMAGVLAPPGAASAPPV